MMANYPTLSPEQIVGVIGGTGSQSNPTQPQAGAPHGGWVSVAEQDWSAGGVPLQNLPRMELHLVRSCRSSDLRGMIPKALSHPRVLTSLI